MLSGSVLGTVLHQSSSRPTLAPYLKHTVCMSRRPRCSRAACLRTMDPPMLLSLGQSKRAPGMGSRFPMASSSTFRHSRQKFCPKKTTPIAGAACVKPNQVLGSINHPRVSTEMPVYRVLSCGSAPALCSLGRVAFRVASEA